MVGLAIAVLWFLIGVIVLCGIVWLALYVLRMFMPTFPARIEQAVWVIVMILVLIYALTLLAGAGGGGGLHFPAIGGR
jgi:hypothetical protein